MIRPVDILRTVKNIEVPCGALIARISDNGSGRVIVCGFAWSYNEHRKIFRITNDGAKVNNVRHA